MYLLRLVWMELAILKKMKNEKPMLGNPTWILACWPYLVQECPWCGVYCLPCGGWVLVCYIYTYMKWITLFWCPFTSNLFIGANLYCTPNGRCWEIIWGGGAMYKKVNIHSYQACMLECGCHWLPLHLLTWNVAWVVLWNLYLEIVGRWKYSKKNENSGKV